MLNKVDIEIKDSGQTLNVTVLDPALPRALQSLVLQKTGDSTLDVMSQDATTKALNTKIDITEGYTLIPDSELARLYNMEDGATRNRSNDIDDALLARKVDKEEGKELVLQEQITRLSNIEDEATKNDSNEHLRDRETHTGKQAIDTITGLPELLDTKVSLEANKSLISDEQLVKLANIEDRATANRSDEMSDVLLARKVDKDADKDLVLNSEIIRLAFMEDKATKNATDAQLRDRGSHTGVQDIDSIIGLAAGLASKVDKEAGKELALTTELTRLSGMQNNATKNRSDAASDLLLDKKVDKEVGKSLIKDTDNVKLSNIAVGATKNATDAQLRARGSHTGTQTMSTIDGLSAKFDTKVDKEVGKSLLSNTEIQRLTAIADGATKNRSDAATDLLLAKKIDANTHVGKGGEVHSIVTSSTAGFMSPEQLFASQNGPVEYYNAEGERLDPKKVRIRFC